MGCELEFAAPRKGSIMCNMHDKSNSRHQRISPWAHMADELRVEARRHAQHDMQLGLMFRAAQEEAYAAWDAWDKAFGGQEALALPRLSVREIAGRTWQLLAETFKCFTVGDLPWQTVGATLGTESRSERE